MADAQASIGIKITADGDGASQAEAAVKRVGKAATKASAEARGGFEQMQGAVGKVQGAFGALRNVLTGFGIGAFVTSMTAGITKIVGSFGSAKKAAGEFAAIQAKLAEDKAIARLSKDYARLTDAIKAASDAEKHQLEMIDIEVANRRKLEEARLNAAKEDEIAKLDANAEDYAEQLDRIEKKYAAIKASNDASNAKEDVVLARQKMNAEADQADKQAQAQDAASAAIKAKIDKAKREKMKADFEAVDLNDKDKTGTASAVGKTLGQLFTGDWGRMGDAKTEEGDAVRRQAAEKAASLEKEIMGLEEELRKSNEAAKTMRTSAEQTRQKAKAMGGQLEALDIEGNTARKTAARGEEAAQEALDKKHDEQAAKEATIADAEQAKQLLARQKADLEARIRTEQERKTAAGRTVYDAQGAFDQANLGGSSRARQSAQADLKAAQDAAQNVNFAADKAIGALTKTLKDVETRLKAAQSYLESQSKQQKNAWAESPAGE